MRSFDDVLTAVSVCGNDEPLKCPYFDSENWRCCDWEDGRKTHRMKMMDDVQFYLKNYRELCLLVPSLLTDASMRAKKGKTIG